MMKIDSPLEPKVVIDYDFTLEGGIGIPLVIDPTLGDSIEFGDQEVKVFLKGRPTLLDKTKFLAPDEVKISRSKILAYHRREREVLPLTPEQQAEWDKTVQEFGKTQH